MFAALAAQVMPWLILIVMFLVLALFLMYRDRTKWKETAQRTIKEKNILQAHQKEMEKILTGHRELVKEVKNAPTAAAAAAVASAADDDWNNGV